MRRHDPSAGLSEAQRATADAGIKSMTPFERPFIDYVLMALADAGITHVCVVAGPDNALMRRHLFETAPPRRVSVEMVVQASPSGTADAVLHAEDFIRDRLQCGDAGVLVLNADNYYPSSAFSALRTVAGAGVAGFDRATLVAKSNIPAQRIQSFALLQTSGDGRLTGVIEKPDDQQMQQLSGRSPIGMNLWSVTAPILEACRLVPQSSRGERELPQAMHLAVTQLHVPVTVVPLALGVLDLSERGDIAQVAAALRGLSADP